MIVAQALEESLDGVKSLTEIHGDNNLNMMWNEIIRRAETMKHKTQKQENIRDFLKIILYYLCLYCLVVYLKNNFTLSLIGPFLSNKLH